MNRPILALTLTLFVVYSGQAQSSSELVERLQARYAELGTMSAGFDQTMDSEVFDSPQSVAGILYLRGESYRIEAGNDVYTADGESTWVYRAAENQVLVDYFYEDATTLSVSQMLFRFDDRFVVTGHRSRGNTWVLDLAPRDDSDFFRSVTLTMRDADAMITRLLVTDANDVSIDIRLRDIIENPDLPDDLFRFDAPETAEVVDLRS